MKKLIYLSLFFPTVCFGAAPVVVQSTEVFGAFTSPKTFSFNSNVSAGNLIIFRYAQIGGANRAISSITDNLNGHYVLDITTGTNGTTPVSQIYHASNTVSGATTFTVTWANGSDSKDFYVEEVSGCDKVTPLDQTGAHDTGTSVSNHVGSLVPFTTSSNGSIIVMITQSDSPIGGITPAGGYTNIASVSTSIILLEQLASASVVNSTCPYTTGNPRQDHSSVASFKAVASAVNNGPNGSTLKNTVLNNCTVQ